MFCIVKGEESRGRGKVIEASGVDWVVEYFDSPADTNRDVIEVKKIKIIPKKLGANTRIYYQIESTGHWLVGRVLQDMGDGVEVRFSDKNDIFLKYEHLFVRCNKPISDPVDFLANVITETPQYAEARSAFLENYIAQKGGAWGISALLSSVIVLEPHQINVVRRILNDPSQRYLLADEVGLGKTIEAGVVIRQAVLDDPRNHFVVVLAPKTLVYQWRQELIIKFGLIDFIDVSVFVLSQNSLDEIKEKLGEATLLVIDEAHHVAAGDDELSKKLYEIVRFYSKDIERLLLLSATPILRNETGFLRLLHLLDNVVYDLDDEEAFRTKIIHRQILAEAVASLDPQNVNYLDSILDELIDKLPNDERLFNLISDLKLELLKLPESDDPDLIEHIRILRAHLTETYRLHRRILRNRRKQVVGVTPNRSGSKSLLVNGSQFGKLESLLEDWRISASSLEDNSLNKFLRMERSEWYWKVVTSLMTSPEDIKTLCYSRLTDIRNSPNRTFQGEVPLIQEIFKSVDQHQWLNCRLDILKVEISNLLSESNKIIVFCSQSLIADTVFKGLKNVLNDTVVRHEVLEDDEDDSIPWLKFNSSKSVRVIVCDRRAEEGINLQGGQKIVIHFDLPLEPNRVEQRIGRVDRYGSGDAVQSIVLLDNDSKFQSNWFVVLDKALEVFNRSISSLQYLIEQEMQQLRFSLFMEGVEAIEKLQSDLGGVAGKVSRELKLIDQQDGLDELSALPESDMDSLSDIDAGWKEIRSSTLYWACDTLLFGNATEPNEGASLSADTPFRFQYKVPGKGGPATLIALSAFMDDFLGALDYNDRRSTSLQPLSYPHYAKRQSAVARETRILRYGDNFVEALKSFSDTDDRGRSYAMWRQYYVGLDDIDAGMYFRFDFMVEASLEDADSVIKNSSIKLNHTSQSAIARRGNALFPPQVIQVWINEEGEEPSTEFIETFLLPTYDKVGKSRSYIDTNLKSLRFRSLMERAPDTFENWEIRCYRMSVRAQEILARRKNLIENIQSAINRARIEDELRAAQLLTRIRLLEGIEAESEQDQLNIEMKLNEALYKGIKEPSIKVDVAGFVILSANQFQ